jgi:hypothetical protein
MLQGVAFLGILSLCFGPFFCKVAYETFLRAHQAAACLCIYAIWRHLPSYKAAPRIFLFIALGIFLLTSCLQVGLFLYCNSAFTSRGCPRALVTYVGKEKKNNDDGINDDDTDDDGTNDDDPNPIRIRLALSRLIRVLPGQYINLWMRSMSWWPVQSYPLMVTSWSQEKQDFLDLLVQPHRGLTADLLCHIRADPRVLLSFLALVSSPHGISEPASRYKTVLVVASGFGIAAAIPYLKQLIHGYNANLSRTRRVHFVWQLQTIGNIDPLVLCCCICLLGYRYCYRGAVLAQ